MRVKARTAAEVDKATREIMRRNKKLVETLAGNSGARVLFNACQIVEARAKEIIQEKGHVVTGSLVRSINTSIVDAAPTLARVEVGSFMEYAPFVEALPDGGYLFEAAAQTFDQVTAFIIRNGLKPAIEDWGRP